VVSDLLLEFRHPLHISRHMLVRATAESANLLTVSWRNTHLHFLVVPMTFKHVHFVVKIK